MAKQTKQVEDVTPISETEVNNVAAEQTEAPKLTAQDIMGGLAEIANLANDRLSSLKQEQVTDRVCYDYIRNLAVQMYNKLQADNAQ